MAALNIVLVTEHFWSYWAFWRKSTLCFWWQHRVKLILVGKMCSKTVHFWQYTAYSEKKWNFAFSTNLQREKLRLCRNAEWNDVFSPKRGVKQCVFGYNAEWNGAFLATMRYSRRRKRNLTTFHIVEKPATAGRGRRGLHLTKPFPS
jgi:hypothetical protein